MKRSVIILAVVLSSIGAVAAQRSQPPVVEVFKSPTCGCCSKWVDHLRASGFTVKTTETEAIDELKAKHQIPQSARSCHTALVGGYVVEGHVPAADVQRLLKEKPAIAGIAVPGMPIGSPGMEVPGMRAQAFDVVSFTKQGTTRVFASH
jgi:hypothetical protein